MEPGGKIRSIQRPTRRDASLMSAPHAAPRPRTVAYVVNLSMSSDDAAKTTDVTMMVTVPRSVAQSLFILFLPFVAGTQTCSSTQSSTFSDSWGLTQCRETAHPHIIPRLLSIIPGEMRKNRSQSMMSSVMLYWCEAITNSRFPALMLHRLFTLQGARSRSLSMRYHPCNRIKCRITTRLEVNRNRWHMVIIGAGLHECAFRATLCFQSFWFDPCSPDFPKTSKAFTHVILLPVTGGRW